MTVLRRGAPHNSMGGMDTHREDGAAGAGTVDRMQFASATEIRWNLLEGRWDRAEPYLLPGARERLEDSLIGLPALKRVEQVMLARVRTMTAEDWAALPTAARPKGCLSGWSGRGAGRRAYRRFMRRPTPGAIPKPGSAGCCCGRFWALPKRTGLRMCPTCGCWGSMNGGEDCCGG